ncbi:MAG: hypothetical protein JWQ49_5126 [Edaphobacter sp.]|nr:hypothetical protein [Edaphobacter sp.]
MPTVLTSPVSERLQRDEYRRERGFAAGLVTALTFLALLVHGYHPYAEDGGVYLPEIKRLLDPGLYPHGAEFVVGHLRFSLFAPMMAGLVRESNLSLEMVLVLVHLATFWTTLFAAWLLAARCFASREARGGAVALLAVWMTLPIAGTSLMLMDPYVTARSLSTPCLLLALAGALRFLLPSVEMEGDGRRDQWRGLALCCAGLAGAGVMHPLMAAYGLEAVVLLGAVLSRSRRVRVWGTVGLALAAVVMAAGLQLFAPPESDAYQRVVMTRDYWFLSQWQWYELIGLVAPLVILSVVAMGQRREGDAARVGLARMAVIAGVTAMVVALLFAHAGVATHLVARMQPLRIFQMVYVVMTLVVGAWLGSRVLQRRPMRWVLALAVLSGVMVMVERRTFPASKHLELPYGLTGRNSADRGNAYQRAFAWIGRNTPREAFFAMDAHYITKPEEDAQSFRAIAGRSVLPDFSKDGGVVTNKPELATEWLEGQVAQAGLDTEPDARRIAVLRPLGVDWVVLERRAVTGFACPYANEVVKVCRLP